MNKPKCFGIKFTEKPSEKPEDNCKVCYFVDECSDIKLKKCFGVLFNEYEECIYCCIKNKCSERFEHEKFDEMKYVNVISQETLYQKFNPNKDESDFSKLINLLIKGENTLEELYDFFMNNRHSPKKVKLLDEMMYGISLIVEIKKDKKNKIKI